MRMATVATIVFGGQFLARWLLGIDDTRVWALLLGFAVPGLLGALVLLAGVVQQRRIARR
jgi:hypothetical protein